MGQFQMAFRRMIRWRLNEVMAEKRVKGIELAEALGIDPNSVSRMRKRTTMPRLTPEILNGICRFLGCQPGDLLIYADDGPGTTQDSI
jgi:putative transcriptional regulator